MKYHFLSFTFNGIFITIACPCNVYPLEPQFYIAKLGFEGVYLFFLFLLRNIDSGYSLEPPRLTIYVLSKNKKERKKKKCNENFHFLQL